MKPETEIDETGSFGEPEEKPAPSGNVPSGGYL